MEKSPIVLVIEGVIAAGKTTYIKSLEEQFKKNGKKVICVPEPVDSWVESGILQLFYNDPSRWGYTFQTGAFVDRININIEYYNKYKDEADIFILERSPCTDKVFMQTLYEIGDITNIEFDRYKSWCELWERHMPYKPTLYIYLRTDIDTCMERCKDRSRDGESGIKKEYQLSLQKNHDNLLLSLPNCIVVNYQYDLKNSEEYRKLIWELACGYINKFTSDQISV